MNVEEYRRHAHAQDLLKIITYLGDSKSHLLKAIPRIKNFGQSSQLAKDIEQNIDALSAGIQETIALCAHLRDEILRNMQEPDARPLHKQGSLRHYITPFQRMLVREGVELPLTPTTKYIPTKVETRQKKLIRLIPYEQRALYHRKKRVKGKNYIPL
jgi:hypothetical protein